MPKHPLLVRPKPKIPFPTRNVPQCGPRVVLTESLRHAHSRTTALRHFKLFGVLMQEAQKEAKEEKRSSRRFALQIPVSVSRNGNGNVEAGEIRDVSARGVCFYLDGPIEQGSPIGFTLTLPPEITLTESIRVKCQGHVVRIEDGTDAGKMAVAAVIEEYEFLPES